VIFSITGGGIGGCPANAPVVLPIRGRFLRKPADNSQQPGELIFLGFA